ncbi:MAG TPA: hypothetical protein VN612_10995 [Acidobacteriaceae bacterium]|nr:hypothetical protein [Acidobacteriaceae bacterium]
MIRAIFRWLGYVAAPDAEAWRNVALAHRDSPNGTLKTSDNGVGARSDRFTWSVREEGNAVILEFGCRDNYEAIELAEVLALAIGEGHLEMEFEDDGQD